MFYHPLICKNVFLNQGMSVVWHLLSNTTLTQPFPKIRDKDPVFKIACTHFTWICSRFFCVLFHQGWKTIEFQEQNDRFLSWKTRCDCNIKWQSMCIYRSKLHAHSQHKGYRETVKGLNPDLCVISLYSVHLFYTLYTTTWDISAICLA